MKKRIVVTHKDIEAGVAGEPQSCPIALAMFRAFKKGVSVAGPDFRFTEEGYRQYYNLPEQAYNFVHDFDMGKEVQPFQFNVDIFE